MTWWSNFFKNTTNCSTSGLSLGEIIAPQLAPGTRGNQVTVTDSICPN